MQAMASSKAMINFVRFLMLLSAFLFASPSASLALPNTPIYGIGSWWNSPIVDPSFIATVSLTDASIVQSDSFMTQIEANLPVASFYNAEQQSFTYVQNYGSPYTFAITIKNVSDLSSNSVPADIAAAAFVPPSGYAINIVADPLNADDPHTYYIVVATSTKFPSNVTIWRYQPSTTFTMMAEVSLPSFESQLINPNVPMVFDPISQMILAFTWNVQTTSSLIGLSLTGGEAITVPLHNTSATLNKAQLFFNPAINSDLIYFYSPYDVHSIGSINVRMGIETVNHAQSFCATAPQFVPQATVVWGTEEDRQDTMFIVTNCVAASGGRLVTVPLDSTQGVSTSMVNIDLGAIYSLATNVV